ncbi:MAG: aspartate kinase [Bradymonadia bacterium]
MSEQRPSPWRVMKFGGSSVGSPDRLLRVAHMIRETAAEGPLAVVVSAMGDTTDWLIEAMEAAAAGDYTTAEAVVDRVADLAVANGLAVAQGLEISGEAVAITPTVRNLLAPLRQLLYGVSLVREQTAQTLDLVLSFGERLSASILAALLDGVLPQGATFVDARTWTVTDDTFGTALVDWPATEASLQRLVPEWSGKLPIVTGFLGRTADGRTTTLGRNGSDYTATLLARALKAGEVHICTDVSGVMTADPGLVDETRPISRLSYMEALELATFGARMFHPRTMIPLMASGIPMRIRNTMDPAAPGTRVDAQGDDDLDRPTSVTSLERLALIDFQWRRVNQRARLGERVLAALSRAQLTVWMFNQAAHGQAGAVVVPEDKVDVALEALKAELATEIARNEVGDFGVKAPVTLLSLVAEAMGRTPNVAGRLFSALGNVGVLIRAIAQGASSRSVSCVIDAADTPLAVRTVHSAFNLAHQEVSLLLMGKGTVGGHLMAQIESQREALESDHDVRIKVVGLLDSRGYRFAADGLPLSSGDLDGVSHVAWGEAGPPGGDVSPDHPVMGLLDRLQRFEAPILVDCTASGGLAPLYTAAFERGVHVVGANKKPLAESMAAYRALMGAARHHSRFYRYETTCGASLPIIETLQNIVRTGDRVLLIEGAFSGTLGYLANALSAGQTLSEAVKQAHALGYTEPDPREDLSGADMARKAMILARELGLSAESISVEPLVPAEVGADAADLEGFFAALEGYDGVMADRLDALATQGQVLRYLARIEPRGAEAPVITVGPVGVGPDHPSTRLKGTEAFVAFTTERYQDYPLTVQGAGAGGSVTAAGVLGDVLRIAQTLRGR